MLRIISSNAVRSAKNAPLKVIAPVATRNFFWGKKDEAADDAAPEVKVRIRTDKEHQFGRRKEELEAAEEGIEAFENSSLVPPSDAGSWENPIMVRMHVSFIIPAIFFNCPILMIRCHLACHSVPLVSKILLLIK
jgi:hypothetical protein